MKQRAFLQALGVTVYCSAIGMLLFNANKVFGQTPNALAPVIMLMLFSVSALVCALMVFYKPYQLFIAKKGKEAVDLVVQTTAWLFLFAVIVLLLAIFI